MGSYDFPHGGKIQTGTNLERAFFTEWKSGAQNVKALGEQRGRARDMGLRFALLYLNHKTLFCPFELVTCIL